MSWFSNPDPPVDPLRMVATVRCDDCKELFETPADNIRVWCPACLWIESLSSDEKYAILAWLEGEFYRWSNLWP